MITKWTTEEMENILIQLNNSSYPFKKYRFSRNDKGLVKLGSGGYADVYEMELNSNPGEKYAVKVIGFGEKRVDSKEFRDSIGIQKELSLLEHDIVKIIDYTELRVFLDKACNVVDTVKVSMEDDKEYDGDNLKLQFILMERLEPVLTRDKSGKPKLYPEELAAFEETEILKLAHNIGAALARAHNGKLLHRDVKLENVFYDPKRKIYKLGDFGIAVLSEDGMASTVAFTKGYGAPEVVFAKDSRYDNTADIYSYGMMLYLLLNELRFPNSENYNVNMKLQYSKGYQFPAPEHSEWELRQIVEGMCQYDPDMRCQSMENVMNDIEGLLVGKDTGYKKGNTKPLGVAGCMSFVFGIIFLKLSHMPRFSAEMEQYKWLTVLLLSFSFILIMQWSVLRKRDINRDSGYYKFYAYWNFPILVYGLVLVAGIILQYVNMPELHNIEWYQARCEMAEKYDFFKLGLCGTVLSVGFMIREKVLRKG